MNKNTKHPFRVTFGQQPQRDSMTIRQELSITMCAVHHGTHHRQPRITFQSSIHAKAHGPTQKPFKNPMNYTPNHYQNTDPLEIPKQMASQAGKVLETKHLSQNTEECYTDSKQCTSCNATHSLAHCQEASSIDHQSPKEDSNTDSKDEPGWGEHISPTPWNAPDTPTRWLSTRDNSKALHPTHVSKLTIPRLRYTLELWSHAARRQKRTVPFYDTGIPGFRRQEPSSQHIAKNGPVLQTHQ